MLPNSLRSLLLHRAGHIPDGTWFGTRRRCRDRNDWVIHVVSIKAVHFLTSAVLQIRTHIRGFDSFAARMTVTVIASFTRCSLIASWQLAPFSQPD